MKKFKINDRIKIKPGCMKFLKENGFLADYITENVDGMVGIIIGDYTCLPHTSSHYEVDLNFEYTVGIYPDFIESL